MLKRFIVYGTCMESIASLHVEAESPTQAEAAWAAMFPEHAANCRQFNGRAGIGTWDIAVWNLDGEQAHLEKLALPSGKTLWRGNGYHDESGSYCYH